MDTYENTTAPHAKGIEGDMLREAALAETGAQFVERAINTALRTLGNPLSKMAFMYMITGAMIQYCDRMREQYTPAMSTDKMLRDIAGLNSEPHDDEGVLHDEA